MEENKDEVVQRRARADVWEATNKCDAQPTFPAFSRSNWWCFGGLVVFCGVLVVVMRYAVMSCGWLKGEMK